jgi:uncharacterized protein involved in exopolysaccharide biosynthesis
MQEQIENTSNDLKTSDEIDLIKVFKKIWVERKTIFKSLVVFFCLGLIIIIGSPNEYKSEVTLLEESTAKEGSMSGLLSQFGGLAGLGGLGNMNQNESLSPQLYPIIIKTTPFLLEVSKQKIIESRYDSLLSVSSFLDRYSRPSFSEKLIKYTVGLPGTIISFFRKEHREPAKPKFSFILTPQQSKVCGELSKRIKVKEGESAGILTISVEMQDPLVAAQLTDSVVKCLTKYAINYRIQKTKNDLEFIQERFNEIKERYEKTQQALAYYRDQNKNVILASSKTEEERLQSEFTLASTLYNSFAQQLEQAKIKVQENTPVFKVIEPAKAEGKSSPKTVLILVGMLFLGGFIGIGIVFGRVLYAFYISKM